MYIGVLAFFLMAVVAPGALGARPKMDSDKVILERRFEDMRWIKLNAVCTALDESRSCIVPLHNRQPSVPYA